MFVVRLQTSKARFGGNCASLLYCPENHRFVNTTACFWTPGPSAKGIAFARGGSEAVMRKPIENGLMMRFDTMPLPT